MPQLKSFVFEQFICAKFSFFSAQFICCRHYINYSYFMVKSCAFLAPLCHGVPYGFRWGSPNYNKMLLRKKFKEHNAYVMQVSSNQFATVCLKINSLQTNIDDSIFAVFYRQFQRQKRQYKGCFTFFVIIVCFCFW